MTALAFEAPVPVLRPARRVQARRTAVRPIPAVALPETVPAWLMPEQHGDPRFVALARMSGREIGMAMLASGADWDSMRKAGACVHSIEDFIALAMRGLDEIGIPGARTAAARYDLAKAEGRASASGSVKDLGSPSPLLNEIIASGTHRYARAWAFWIALDVHHYGFLHDVSLWPTGRAWPYDRCGLGGICRHCYPDSFAPKTAA